MKITTDLYRFRCITNLHAGAGSSNYGVVDNEVQRDPIDEMPIVHTSSLKGAFRELFDSFSEDQDGDFPMRREDIVKVFGTDNTGERTGTKDFAAGQYYFYPAHLLYYPVRSSVRPFFYATSKSLIDKFVANQEDMGTEKRENLERQSEPFRRLNPDKEEPIVFTDENDKAFIDEYQAVKTDVAFPATTELIVPAVNRGNLAFFHDDDMKEICKRLPVIARNKLNNGLSVNLWYEEVVPRESWFYFFVSRPESDVLFETGLRHSKINRKVQIGGNASVGYGLCKLLERIGVGGQTP